MVSGAGESAAWGPDRNLDEHRAGTSLTAEPVLCAGSRSMGGVGSVPECWEDTASLLGLDSPSGESCGPGAGEDLPEGDSRLEGSGEQPVAWSWWRVSPACLLRVFPGWLWHREQLGSCTLSVVVFLGLGRVEVEDLCSRVVLLQPDCRVAVLSFVAFFFKCWDGAGKAARRVAWGLLTGPEVSPIPCPCPPVCGYGSKGASLRSAFI